MTRISTGRKILFGETMCHSLMRNYFASARRMVGIRQLKQLSSDCVKHELPSTVKPSLSDSLIVVFTEETHTGWLMEMNAV